MLHLAVSFVLAATALVPQATPPSPPSETSSVAITGVTVVDVASGRLVPRQTVVVRGNRIVAVGPSSAAPPADAQLVDGTGKFLIPGLWDMHVHTPADAETRAVYLPLEIANGITGVRVMWGGPDHLTERADVASGTLLGPRMVVATPVLDGRMWRSPSPVGSPEEARRTVESLARQGYDFVKTYQFLPRDVYLAIADEAKRLGIPFAGHAPLTLTAAEASDAGQRSFEHNMGLALACSRDEARIRSVLVADEAKLPPYSFAEHVDLMVRTDTEPLSTLDPDKCSALAATLRKNGTWLVPTLTLYRARGASPGSPVREDARLKYIPAEIRSGFASAPPIPAFDTLRPHLGRLATMMQRAGVGILAGTDTHNPYVLPGFSLHDELALLVEAGFSSLEALQAATLNPARFLNATDSMGTIAPGKLADLVLLDADPLTDIHNTTKIRAVVANGRYLDRAALDAVLAGVERVASAAAPAERTLASATQHSARTPPEAILDLEQRLTAALLDRDAAAVGSLLADDLVHVGFEGQIAGKAEYMSFFEHGNWRYSKYLPSDVSVKLLGDTAVVTGKVSRSIVIDGRETTGAFALTHVWVRSSGGWRLSSSHVTTIPPRM
jgi:imidazolonepropionase-like amidohydrolase/ketosteroid isomerase-like protein